MDGRGISVGGETTRPQADFEDSVNGDLGLGSGLKPGSIFSASTSHSSLSSLYGSSENNEGVFTPASVGVDLIKTLAHTNLDKDVHGCPAVKSKQIPGGKLRRLFSRSSSKSSRKSSADQSDVSEQQAVKREPFPTYADIPYGTSIRQQKLLFEQDLGHIFHKKSPLNVPDNCSLKGQDRHVVYGLKSEDIDKKLVQATQEVEELHLELENCQRRLDAKYRAIEILKQQAVITVHELEEHDLRTSEYSHKLEKEVNHLQFALDYQQSSTLDSQRMWATRFDRACQENTSLLSKLSATSEELRKMTAKNMALLREKEELLALLDVQERQQYEKSRSVSSDEDYNSFSSSELAVLGACMCRGSRPEPCGCAVAAANMRKEILKLKEELEMYRQQTDEAHTTVDAYREAFDEQIKRNKAISAKLVEVSMPNPTKASKAKDIIRWIISTLSDDNKPESVTQDLNANGPLTTDGEKMVRADLSHIDVDKCTDRELLLMLLDMVNERLELNAQQKLAARILANRNQELESRLESANDDSGYM